MPATMKANTTAGPARSAMAAAVRTNSPAPMMAPMPSAMSDHAPSVRLSVPSPVARLSAMSESMDLVLNSEPATRCPLSCELENERDYIRSLQSGDVFTHAPFRISAGEQVGDHGDRPGAGFDDRRRALQGDAADCDDGRPFSRGVLHEFEPLRIVAGVFRARAKH